MLAAPLFHVFWFRAGPSRPPACQFRGFSRKRGRRSSCGFPTVKRTRPRRGAWFRLRLHLNTCIPDGYPPARFSGHDMLYTAAANCSDPRTASDRHGGEQCGPQPLLWYSVPASCTPYIAGGSEGTLCLPSASGCRSRALRPAVLPPDGEACVSRKTLFPAQSVPDSLDVHRGLLVAVAFFIPPMARALCRNAHRR